MTIENGGHFTGEILGFIGAFEFVEKAFAGTVASGCSQQSVLDNSFSPIALGANLEPLLVSLLNALLQFGDEDANVLADISTLNETFTNSSVAR